MNLPNFLTILRFFLTALFVYYIFKPGIHSKLLAASIFLLASLTDFYDGYLARKYHLITDFGKLMDPIADKFLILSAFFVFGQMHIIAWWMFLVVFIREIFVTIDRLFKVKKGRVVAAEKAGKLKTIVQVVMIIVVLFYLMLVETSRVSSQETWMATINALMIIVVILTLYSGASYLRQNNSSAHA